MIPDGFYLETYPDAEFEGLILWTPDLTTRIELGIQDKGVDAKTDFETYFEAGSELDSQIRSTMVSTIVNGLSGYQASYVSNGSAFIEYRLKLPEGGLMWLMLGQKGTTPQKVQQSAHLRAMLENIRKEV